MILQAEYHASSICLRRVLLLRSVIRLTPSDICFASLWANRISLKPQGFNITFFWKYLATGEVFSKENITLTIVSISLNRQKEREDSLIYESSLFCCSVGLGYCPTEFVHTNAMLVLNRNRYDYKFSDKNNNYFRTCFLFY